MLRRRPCSIASPVRLVQTAYPAWPSRRPHARSVCINNYTYVSAIVAQVNGMVNLGDAWHRATDAEAQIRDEAWVAEATRRGWPRPPARSTCPLGLPGPGWSCATNAGNRGRSCASPTPTADGWLPSSPTRTQGGSRATRRPETAPSPTRASRTHVREAKAAGLANLPCHALTPIPPGPKSF